MNDLDEVIGGFAAAEEAEKKAIKDKEAAKRDALKEIEKLTAKAYKTVEEAEAIADKYGVTFDFGVAYGMSGTYYPPRDTMEEDEDGWYSSNEGWVSSSSQC